MGCEELLTEIHVIICTLYKSIHERGTPGADLGTSFMALMLEFLMFRRHKILEE